MPEPTAQKVVSSAPPARGEAVTAKPKAPPTLFHKSGRPAMPGDKEAKGSKRPVLKGEVSHFYLNDDRDLNVVERECFMDTAHEAHPWYSHMLNSNAYCFGTGVRPPYGTAKIPVTTTSWKKKMNDYAEGWREDYSVPITVFEARQIAFDMHKDDVDKSGEEYWMHLEAVRAGVEVLGGDHEEQIAALFHDAVEDGHTTFKILESLGVSEHSRKMIEAVSKKTSEEQNLYLGRIIEGGPGSMRVKLADLLHNTRHDRMEKVKAAKGEATHDRLLKKYRPSIARLMLELGIIVDEDEQKKLATKPIGSTYTTTTYTSPTNKDGSTHYKGSSLFAGDWPATWSAPIKEKKKGYSNVYLLTDGTEKVVHADKSYRLWTKSTWVDKQKKDSKFSPANEPVAAPKDATSKPSMGDPEYRPASAQGHKYAKSYAIDTLFRGDWVSYWHAPILTMLDSDDPKYVIYLLANGESKRERISNSWDNKVRTVQVWPLDVWSKNKEVKPIRTSEYDLLDYLNAVESVTGADLAAARITDGEEDADTPSGEPVTSTFEHSDGRKCAWEYGNWWFREGAGKVIWHECVRSHGDGPDEPDDTTGPACGSGTPHAKHYLTSRQRWCMGVEEADLLEDVEKSLERAPEPESVLPECTDAEVHAAHWMTFGKSDTGRVLCPGVKGKSKAKHDPAALAERAVGYDDEAWSGWPGL